MKKYFFIFPLIVLSIIFPKNVLSQCSCNENAVEIGVNRSTVAPGDDITFSVIRTDGEGTLCVSDNLGGATNCDSGWICDPDCHIRLGSVNPSRSTTCEAPSSQGTHTFTHYWRTNSTCSAICTPGDCEISVNYTVDVNAPPPSIPSGLLCDTNTGIDTAIGCIPVHDTTAFAGFILRWGFGIGGGIAFLLIIMAGFQIITSGGSPDKVKAGQQLLTAAISGLVLIIFSTFILEILGVRILRLPAF